MIRGRERVRGAWTEVARDSEPAQLVLVNIGMYLAHEVSTALCGVLTGQEPTFAGLVGAGWSEPANSA